MVEIKDEKFEQLNEILYDIVYNSNKEKYVDLFNHQFIKNKFNKVCYRYYKNSGSSVEDIKSEAKVQFFELLDKFKGGEKDVIGYTFLAYLNSTLYFSLCKCRNISLSEEDNNNTYVVSLEKLGLSVENLEDYIYSTQEEELVSDIYISEFVQNLSDREKEVFYYAIVKGYTIQETGDKLNIAKSTARTYRTRMMEKFKSYVEQEQNTNSLL